MNSVPSQLYDGGLPRADEVSAMSAQSNEIVKGSRVTFKESAHVLQRIVEFMYLGEIADLEEGKSTSSEDDYNLWMWLLTWCAHVCLLPAQESRGWLLGSIYEWSCASGV